MTTTPTTIAGRVGSTVAAALLVGSALTVGSAVSAARSKIGVVVDLAGVERQALARYTQDAGNNVSLSVRPAAVLSVR